MKYKVLLLTSITLLTSVFAGNAKNVLELKHSITDNAIVYPSSFETDTKEMMENWYLKNYAVIDQNSIESRDYGEVSDKIYIQRLKDMPTSIEMPFNQIVKSYIERYVKRGRTLVAQMLGMGRYYMPIFEEALEKYQLPLELKYIPIIESALNPNAVSPAGAGGLWQFMPATGKGLGLELNSLVDERRDPYRSSEMAAKFFKQLYSTYGDWTLAIAAYNCGPGNVNKAIRRCGNEHPDFWEIYNYLPKETRGYVPGFIAATYAMTYYNEHNIRPTLTTKPLVIDTVHVNYRVNFSQIAQVLNIPVEEIRILNPQYRQDVIPGTPNHPYSLALPSQQIYSYIMAEPEIAKYHAKQFAGRSTVQPGDVKTIVDDEVVNEPFLYHEVVDGEYFEDIADRYGMQYDDLMELNGLTSTSLTPGQVLKVNRPGATSSETVMGGTYNGNGGYGSQTAYEPRPTTPTYSAPQPAGPSGRDNRPVPQPQRTSTSQSQPKSSNPTPKTQQTAPQQPKSSQTTTYVVKEGDNLTRLAATYNVSQDAIMEINNLTSETIQIGQRLKIPAPGTQASRNYRRPTQSAPAGKTVNHVVQEGDNLTRLAARYNVSQEKIMEANGLTSDNIQTGQVLKIPASGNSASYQPAKPTVKPVQNTQQKPAQTTQQKPAQQQQKPAQKQATQQKPAQKQATQQKPAQKQATQQKQAQQKPAQKQTQQKPAQQKTQQKPAQQKTQQKPAQQKTQQKPAQQKTQQKPAQQKTQQKPAQQKTQQKPAQKTQQKPAQKTQQKPAQQKSGNNAVKPKKK